MACEEQPDEKRELLLKFKERISDLDKPEIWDVDYDKFLSRWLIARDWDLDKAENMLRKSMEFRKQTNCDALLTTYKAPEVLAKYYIGGTPGFDKNGLPIWLEPIGKLDPKGILHSVTKQQVLIHKAWTCECLLDLCRKQTVKTGKPVDQIIVIFDVHGMGWRHLWGQGIDLLKDIIQLFEDNYPELLNTTYIIRAPKLFVIAYNLIKSVISPRTTSKVHVLGSQWQSELFKAIDADQLPAAYGGTQLDENGDPNCSSKVLYGGDVPKRYYFTSEDIPSDMCAINIPRSSVKQIEYDVSYHCKLSYRIKSDKHDIAFGILYKRSKDNSTKLEDMETILPITRTNTHQIIQEGSIDCKKIGTYLLVLDNSFSWTRGKTVSYSVEMSAADGEKDSFSSSLDLSTSDELISDLVPSTLTS